MDSQPLPTLPSYSSPTLHLTHPTPSERLKIWTTTALSWDNTAPELLPLCLQRLEYQTTIPLAKSGGMTMWILTDSRSAPEHRPLLASCETFRKRAFFTRKDGDGVADRTVHGIASVFTPPLYRRQGFAGRLMRELKAALVGWQATVTSSSLLPSTPCIGSILYSDIGPTYYAKLGWEASGSNKEYIFQIPQQAPDLQHDVRPITRAQLAELCSCDERLIRKAMGAFAHACRGGSGAVVIIPDLDHMLWHMAKDEFTAEMYLGGIPLVKGAVVGCPGERVWVAWTHSYCRHPLAEGVGAENGLYILRLVVEEESTATVEKLDRLVQSVRGVLQAAQCEALQWRLGYLSLWEPSEVIRGLIERCGIEFEVSQRTDAGIASGMWYGEDGDVLSEPPLWVYNERYAYC